eukprot:COSAG01_NODE_18501_length_1071_cov_38.978395_3_plen_59_part_01
MDTRLPQVHDDAFCVLSTEFIVYVDAVSMQPATQYLIMSSTAMGCALGTLFVCTSVPAE